jgi:hypothetical protein
MPGSHVAQRPEHELVDGQETVGHRDRRLLRDLFSVHGHAFEQAVAKFRREDCAPGKRSQNAHRVTPQSLTLGLRAEPLFDEEFCCCESNARGVAGNDRHFFCNLPIAVTPWSRVSDIQLKRT